MRKFLFIAILFFSIQLKAQQFFIKGNYPNFYISHQVLKGETFKSIGILYNLLPGTIANFNALTFTNDPVLSRVLKVPLSKSNFVQSKASNDKKSAPVYYTILSESLRELSAKFKLEPTLIAKWNPATNVATGNKIIVGFIKLAYPVTPPLAEPQPTGIDSALKQVYVPKSPSVRSMRTRPATDTIDIGGPLPVIANQPKETKQTTTPVIATEEAPKKVGGAGRLKVYVDCSNTWCDDNFIKTEINIVDFLLDRIAADVHVLITSQQNGSGGSQLQLIFYGQNKFKNLPDTLSYNIDPNATESERRDAIAKYIKLGLTPFILKTNYADDISIQMKQTSKNKTGENSNKSTTDKWNYWVFRLGASGNLSLDKIYKSNSYRSNISADRTTDKLKVNLGIYGNSNVSMYEYETPAGTEKLEVKNSSYGVNHGIVVSINQHWCYGYEANYTNSTFPNNKSRIYVSPAIEYAIFPYKMVNNKFLTLRYGVDFTRNKYYDTTVFNKTKESLFGHNLSLNLSLNQKWGNINSSVSYRNYFSDWTLNNLGIYLNVEVRITGGLSFYGYTFGGLTRDQIYLAKGGATEQEIWHTQ